MAREYPNAPLPGVLALVVRDDSILLVQRAKAPDQGKWGFPGGMIELGETIADAAIRELAEETGVAAVALSVLTTFDAITRDEQSRVRFHYVLSVQLCRWTAGEPVAGDDALAAGWFRLEEMEEGRIDLSRNARDLARQALLQAAWSQWTAEERRQAAATCEDGPRTDIP